MYVCFSVEMKGVVALKFTNFKNCLGVISSSFVQSTNRNANHIHVFCVSTGNQVAYVSALPSTFKDDKKNQLCINGIYASKLGFADGSGVLIESHEAVGCASAWIEPVSVDDWEILELHADDVESQMLDQIRVLWPGQIFPLWISGNICIFLKTVKVEPPADCSLLIPLTELIITPKVDRNYSRPKTNLISSKRKSLDQSKPASTLPPVPKGESVGSDVSNANSVSKSIKSRSFFRVLCDICVGQLICLFKFLFIILREHIPAAFSRFLKLLYPSISYRESLSSAVGTPESWISDHASSIPEGFAMVARVEPAMFEQSSFRSSGQFLANQPNTVFLHSSDNVNHCQPDMFLILLKKYSSPAEKLMEYRIKKFKNNSDNKASFEDKKISAMDKCVVRMYLHPQSKFAMVRNWKMVCKSHHLKVPSCLRRQMNLSVSSKVCLQKLSISPLSSKEVKGISLDITSDSSLVNSVSIETIETSFKDWIAGISDCDNPVPITVGVLFIFSVVLTKDDPLNRNELTIEAVVTDINIDNKFKKTDKKNNRAYLFSYTDFTRVQLLFNKVKQHNLPSSFDLDLKIPTESVLVYCKGLESEVKALERFVDLALSSRPLSGAVPHGELRQTCALVCGAKGTGKTILCRSMLNKYASNSNLNAYVQAVSCGHWRGKKPENVKRHCDEILYELLWRQPAVLLLDDLDQLIPASHNNDEEKTPDSVYTLQLVAVMKSFLQALSGKILDAWEEIPQIAVLVTSKSHTSLHPIMTSSGTHLFSFKLNIELPSFSARSVVLKSLIENFTEFQPPSDLEEVLNLTEGFAAADLVGLVRRSNHLIQQKKFVAGSQSKNVKCPSRILTTEIILEALSGFTPASLQNAHVHKPLPLTWNDVGGLRLVKQKLQEQLLWPVKYRHLFNECGLQTQSGVLLFGPPGCGKTLIAGVVAGECKLNFISIKGPEVLSKYIGASEAAVRDLFARAKAAAPCVLFFDEFDSLAPKRGHDSTGVTDRVVNQLLTHLDGVEPLEGVTVMAASSRPDLLDPALLRPGRLDNLLYCPFPGIDERFEILKSLSSKLNLVKIDLLKLAEVCENFTGADLKALLYNAQLEAVHETIHDPEPISHATISELSDVTVNSIVDGNLGNGDLRLSNGISSSEDQDNDPTVSNVKSTKNNRKAKAALKMKNKAGQAKRKPHGGYQVRFSDDTDPEKTLKKDILNNQKSLAPERHLATDVIYFSTLHQGRADCVPPNVARIAESVFERSHNGFNESTTAKSNDEVLIIKRHHIEQALTVTRPSVTAAERKRFESMYSNFIRSRERGSTSEQNYYSDKLRTTLS